MTKTENKRQWSMTGYNADTGEAVEDKHFLRYDIVKRDTVTGSIVDQVHVFEETNSDETVSLNAVLVDPKLQETSFMLDGCLIARIPNYPN